jgi:hypothetical protein
LSSLAAADIIFQRVLHDTDYGGKRLTYDFFCKALCLVAADIYPELDWESAPKLQCFFSFFFGGGKFLNVVWETRMIISPPNVKKDGSFFLGYIEMAMEKENHFGDLCHGWYSMW